LVTAILRKESPIVSNLSKFIPSAALEVVNAKIKNNFRKSSTIYLEAVEPVKHRGDSDQVSST